MSVGYAGPKIVMFPNIKQADENIRGYIMAHDFANNAPPYTNHGADCLMQTKHNSLIR